MDMIMAQTAMDAVLKQWGAEIPTELQALRAEQIFVLHSTPLTYQTSFSVMWDAAFRKVVEAECIAARRPVPGATAAGAQLFGFVSATSSALNRQRRIHINPQSTDPNPINAAAHEYIHFLSHVNFYPDYYKSGGDNPFRVGGATEWLALMCFDQYGIAYQAQLDKTFAWIQADSGNVPRLLAFVFRGIYTDLSSIHP